MGGNTTKAADEGKHSTSSETGFKYHRVNVDKIEGVSSPEESTQFCGRSIRVNCIS